MPTSPARWPHSPPPRLRPNRSKALNAADQTVSKQAAEAAAAQGARDAAKLQLLRRRVGLEWSPALARLSDARRGKLIADIAAGRAALVRIDAASGLTQFSGSADHPPCRRVPRTRRSSAPPGSADPRLQATGLLALVSGPAAVQLGTGAVGRGDRVERRGRRGRGDPARGLLRTAGQTFVYVRKDAGNFERRLVPAGVNDAEGAVRDQRLSARASRSVVAGASQLFAARRRQRAGPSSMLSRIVGWTLDRPRLIIARGGPAAALWRHRPDGRQARRLPRLRAGRGGGADQTPPA